MPPGASANLDDRELVRIEAVIQSMTRVERDDPNSLIREPSRVQRIARGSGQKPEVISELVQKFLFMRQMMGGFGQDLGFLGNIPGMKNLAMAKNLKKAMQGGGFPGMGFPGMPGLPGMGMPGMGLGGMGMPQLGVEDSLTKKKPVTAAERNARKAARRRQRGARKKGRR